MSDAFDNTRKCIEKCRFREWRGLPRECPPEVLFGISLDSSWGELPLGSSFLPARSRLLEMQSYYRPIIYARAGSIVLFDGMNPSLSDSWADLLAALGEPEANLDWVHGTVLMSGGECVYPSRGIAILRNPENDFIVHVSLFVPTSLDCYQRELRLNHEKRYVPIISREQ